MNIKMPFGKHRGQFIPDVPHDYLIWCLNKAETMSAELRQAIKIELQGRDYAKEIEEAKERNSKLVDLLDCANKELEATRKLKQPTAETLKYWWRTMAKRWHPDRNKDVSQDAMKAINDGYEWLKRELEV